MQEVLPQRLDAAAAAAGRFAASASEVWVEFMAAMPLQGQRQLLKPQRKQRADTQEINSGPRGAHEQIHAAVNIWGSARAGDRREGAVSTAAWV